MPTELAGWAIGAPSVVDFETGRVVSSVNVPLADVPLRHVLSDRLGVPVFVDNDATVAALAEAFDEQLRPVALNLVMLTIGTGVGGGIVLGGRIYRGSTGAAGELGHTIVGAIQRDRSRRHHFPQPGSLESLAAGHALDHLGAELAEAEPDSALGRLRARGGRSPAWTRWTLPTTAIRGRSGWSRCGRSGSASGWPTRSTRSTLMRS